MIIRNDRRRFPGGRLLLALLVIAGMGAVLFSVLRNEEEKEESEIKALYATSAEDTAGIFREAEGKRRVYFIEGADSFMNGQTRSNQAARTGNFSSAVDQKEPYGIGYEFKNLMGGEEYEARIWRNSHTNKGDFVFDAQWEVYELGKPTGMVEGEWEEMLIKFRVPSYVNKGVAKVYVYNPLWDYVYFDDLEVRKTRGTDLEERGNLPPELVRTLNIVIEDRHYQKLTRKRDEALRAGLLQTGNDDFVPIRVEENGESMKAKMRLKGDWTDHLMGDKWSYRVKMAKGESWNRLVTFSLQSPETRSFLMEYVYHQMLHQEDLLAPRYDFVHLKINGQTRGVYAYEEHFEKQVPEYNKRREGPIMKFVEDGFWAIRERYNPEEFPDLSDRTATFESAEIEPFHSSRYLKDSVMLKQMKMAQDLMYAYQHGQRSVWDVFDAEKLAKYYAVVDLMKAHHGFIWHNQRLYYNPVLSKLEPIGFDGYTSTGPLVWIKKPFVGYGKNFRYMTPAYRGLMFERTFLDYKFVSRYVYHLNRITQPVFLEKFLASLEENIQLREKIFRKEWHGYTYKRDFLLDEAKKMRIALYPFEKTSVKTYFQGKSSKGATYRIFNYHSLPVKLLGVGNNRAQIVPFTRDTLLPAYARDFPPEMTELTAAQEGKYMYYDVPGLDSIFQCEILPWEAPGGPTPEQELFSNLTIQSNDIYTVDEKTKEVRFKAGKYQTKENILIPPGYQVVFEPGVDLDMVAGAMFVSKSRIMGIGREDLPIHIHSSDKTAKGFTVLQIPDGQKTEFMHTVFEGLRSLEYKGWTLTGAVTLYESEAFFLNCRFLHNNSEDAVNVVRSVFSMEKCYIGYTTSDGLDADFCSVTLDRCTFYKTGNDGMDFSGSDIFVKEALVEGSGDKAVSVGEESKAEIIKLKIRDCQAGVASKDLSEVLVHSADMENVDLGFAVFQKKPEYGPSNLKVLRYKATSIDKLYKVQTGCVLDLKGEKIEGKW